MPIDGAAAGVVDGRRWRPSRALRGPENQESTGAGGGDIVQGAAQRRDQLVSKMYGQSGRLPADGNEDRTGLLPHGGSGLKNVTVPKRREFGPEGNEVDAAHEAAMKQFSVKEFGTLPPTSLSPQTNIINIRQHTPAGSGQTTDRAQNKGRTEQHRAKYSNMTVLVGYNCCCCCRSIKRQHTPRGADNRQSPVDHKSYRVL